MTWSEVQSVLAWWFSSRSQHPCVVSRIWMVIRGACCLQYVWERFVHAAAWARFLSANLWQLQVIFCVGVRFSVCSLAQSVSLSFSFCAILSRNFRAILSCSLLQFQFWFQCQFYCTVCVSAGVIVLSNVSSNFKNSVCFRIVSVLFPFECLRHVRVSLASAAWPVHFGRLLFSANLFKPLSQLDQV